ncbi:MAG: hypothetical protein KGI38_09995 [Thaumarchaeota archaeon]|nr:hypothetical protein [Nitrososphaerota archaeon]
MGLPAAAAAIIAVLLSASFIGLGLRKFAKGRDGKYSLTNVQLIMWTGVIIGSYVGISALNGGFLGDLPANLMELMGISAGSYVTAASTRAAQSGRMKRKHPAIYQAKRRPPSHGILDLVTAEGDSEHWSIPKLQVLFWTAVAILIYVIVAANNFQSGSNSLPDPGSGLVILMGISHGAYLGNKLSDDPFEADMP